MTIHAAPALPESHHVMIGKDPMRTPRHGIGAAAVGNRIYVPGGGTQPGYASTNVNEAYVP